MSQDPKDRKRKCISLTFSSVVIFLPLAPAAMASFIASKLCLGFFRMGAPFGLGFVLVPGTDMCSIADAAATASLDAT
jgi:hypothetical protein